MIDALSHGVVVTCSDEAKLLLAKLFFENCFAENSFAFLFCYEKSFFPKIVLHFNSARAATRTTQATRR